MLGNFRRGECVTRFDIYNSSEIVCFYKCYLILQNGDVWKSGKCQLFSCNNGEVTRYEPSCPICPRGMVPTTQNNSDCCPQCQPIICTNHCSVCLPDHPHPFCTVCRKGYYRQSGRCVKKCGEGSFQQGSECISCHPSCAACSQATMFHCTE